MQTCKGISLPCHGVMLVTEADQLKGADQNSTDWVGLSVQHAVPLPIRVPRSGCSYRM